MTQRAGLGASGMAERRAERAGVERVDGVHAAADADDLAAEVGGQQGIVGFGVAEDEDPGAGRDSSGDLPLDERALASPGLSQDELARVDGQPCAQPGQRVQAGNLAGQLVPADRGADGWRTRACEERVQAADLVGRALVLRGGANVCCSPCAGDPPPPGRRDGRGGTGTTRLALRLAGS